MKTGDIVLLSFPFAEQHTGKVRPTAVVCETADSYKDLVVCAISSVVPTILSTHEMLVIPDQSNNLRATSTLKVDRIVTVKKQDIIAHIGTLNEQDLEKFKTIFRNLL